MGTHCDAFSSLSPKASSGGVGAGDTGHYGNNHYSHSEDDLLLATTPHPNARSSQQQNKLNSKKSVVWRYFKYEMTHEGVENRQKTVCSLCGNSLCFNTSGTTTTMLNHLKSKHPETCVKINASTTPRRVSSSSNNGHHHHHHHHISSQHQAHFMLNSTFQNLMETNENENNNELDDGLLVNVKTEQLEDNLECPTNVQGVASLNHFTGMTFGSSHFESNNIGKSSSSPPPPPPPPPPPSSGSAGSNNPSDSMNSLLSLVLNHQSTVPWMLQNPLMLNLFLNMNSSFNSGSPPSAAAAGMNSANTSSAFPSICANYQPTTAGAAASVFSASHPDNGSDASATLMDTDPSNEKRTLLPMLTTNSEHNRSHSIHPTAAFVKTVLDLRASPHSSPSSLHNDIEMDRKVERKLQVSEKSSSQCQSPAQSSPSINDNVDFSQPTDLSLSTYHKRDKFNKRKQIAPKRRNSDQLNGKSAHQFSKVSPPLQLTHPTLLKVLRFLVVNGLPMSLTVKPSFQSLLDVDSNSLHRQELQLLLDDIYSRESAAQHEQWQCDGISGPLPPAPPVLRSLAVQSVQHTGQMHYLLHSNASSRESGPLAVCQSVPHIAQTCEQLSQAAGGCYLVLIDSHKVDRKDALSSFDLEHSTLLLLPCFYHQLARSIRDIVDPMCASDAGDTTTALSYMKIIQQQFALQAWSSAVTPSNVFAFIDGCAEKENLVAEDSTFSRVLQELAQRLEGVYLTQGPGLLILTAAWLCPATKLAVEGFMTRRKLDMRILEQFLLKLTRGKVDHLSKLLQTYRQLDPSHPPSVSLSTHEWWKTSSEHFHDQVVCPLVNLSLTCCDHKPSLEDLVGLTSSQLLSRELSSKVEPHNVDAYVFLGQLWKD